MRGAGTAKHVETVRTGIAANVSVVGTGRAVTAARASRETVAKVVEERSVVEGNFEGTGLGTG